MFKFEEKQYKRVFDRIATQVSFLKKRPVSVTIELGVRVYRIMDTLPEPTNNKALITYKWNLKIDWFQIKLRTRGGK